MLLRMEGWEVTRRDEEGGGPDRDSKGETRKLGLCHCRERAGSC